MWVVLVWFGLLFPPCKRTNQVFWPSGGQHSHPHIMPPCCSRDHINHKKCITYFELFWRPMATGTSYNSSVHYIHSYATRDRHGQARTLSSQGNISHHCFKVPAYDIRDVTYDPQGSADHTEPYALCTLALSSYRAEVEYTLGSRHILQYPLE